MSETTAMGFEVAGSSTDTGNSKTTLGWPGLLLAQKAAIEQKLNALLLNGLPCFGEAAIDALPILQSIEQSGTAVYSPLQGRINICKGGSQ